MSRSILIVDDEKDLVELMAEEFEGRGFQVQIAVDGETAIQKLKEKRFDAVVSDVRMPHFNGVQLLSWVRENWPSTAFFFMSGYNDLEDGAAKGLSVEGIFTKPFSLVGLIDTVITHLEQG